MRRDWRTDIQEEALNSFPKFNENIQEGLNIVVLSIIFHASFKSAMRKTRGK